jgi:hypothetical protein
MAAHDYMFFTEWRLPGTCREAYEILSRAEELPRWWPSVYLSVQVLEAGGADGVGGVVRLHSRARLPYTLRWQFRVTEACPGRDGRWALALEAWGDLEGEGRWSFREEGPDVVIGYDWRVRAEKPLLRRLSWLFKPLFSANHRWAMEQGEQSLRAEMDRRRSSPAEAA